MNDIFSAGFDLFKKEPELMLAEVWRRAHALGHSFDDQHTYVDGFCAARAKHDDYLREQKNG